MHQTCRARYKAAKPKRRLFFCSTVSETIVSVKKNSAVISTRERKRIEKGEEGGGRANACAQNTVETHMSITVPVLFFAMRGRSYAIVSGGPAGVGRTPLYQLAQSGTYCELFVLLSLLGVTVARVCHHYPPDRPARHAPPAHM